MSLFKIPSAGTKSVQSPVEIFRDLVRNPSIKFLWDHQAGVLNTYHENHRDDSDVMIELPTGRGKTLVALLVAESHRRQGRRVAFLCSNKQLCGQVVEQSSSYGIPCVLLTGPQSEYLLSDFGRYQRAESIAITTYSGLFNISPRINDPHVVICDDAHAADSYVSGLWTLTINRYTTPNAFKAVYAALRGVMSDNAAHRIETAFSDNAVAVEMISPIAFASCIPALMECITANCAEGSIRYEWSMISGHLDACVCYCTGNSFEFRPIISPVMTHAPFARAIQRVYVSATPGADGDLERTFGVNEIKRLELKADWRTVDGGRRLILFPSICKEPDSAMNGGFMNSLLQEAGRTLMLVASDAKRKVLEDFLNENSVSCLSYTDAGRAIDEFRLSPAPVALVLSNRYDGIDFPGAQCGSMVLFEFPRGAGLQELFLTQRLKACSVTRDRLRTRIVQAMGRCTRSPSDSCVIIIIGDELVKWLCTSENIQGVNTALQVEVDFGLKNSEAYDSATMLEVIKQFVARSDDWVAAEAYLRSQAKSLSVIPDASADLFKRTAIDECKYVYSAWRGDWSEAYLCADRVLARLSGNSDITPYRAFWVHQSAVSAYSLSKVRPEFINVAKEKLREAAAMGVGYEWLSGALKVLSVENSSLGEGGFDVSAWYGNLDLLIQKLGVRGGKYAKQVGRMHEYISSTAQGTSATYQSAICFLGGMLGFGCVNWETAHAAPDGFWNICGLVAIVFEAKAEATASTLSVATARQASSHEAYARGKNVLPSIVPIVTVIVSDNDTIHPDAKTLADEMRHVRRSALISLYARAMTAFGELRTMSIGANAGVLSKSAYEIYARHKILPKDVIAELTSVSLDSLPVSK